MKGKEEERKPRKGELGKQELREQGTEARNGRAWAGYDKHSGLWPSSWGRQGTAGSIQRCFRAQDAAGLQKVTRLSQVGADQGMNREGGPIPEST